MHAACRTLGAISALLAWVAPLAALPPSFVDLPVADDWQQASGLTFAPDGRMFVWEKAGRVWNVENGVKADQPLIEISEEVGNWRDYGLLGFAVDPDFYTNGHIYLLYVVDYHHLIHFGTPEYDPLANWFFHDTIARLTRYTCTPGDGFRSVDYGTRQVLIGETIGSGFPICHQSHGIGSLVFGEDGSLLAASGDAASYNMVDIGGPLDDPDTTNTCLPDGIITAAEDVGAFRAQLPDSLNGKILHIDPATGDGLPSNPLYDAQAPGSARSRLWALGLRNPFRMGLRPGSGNADPAAADPGTLYIGDVGWFTWEDLHVCDGPGQNFGWPIYEGMEQMPLYSGLNVENLAAPNPLFGTTPPGQGPCTQEYFYFRDLLVQDTPDPDPSFPNPCDPAQEIPASIPRHVHQRPPVDYSHGGFARVAVFQGSQPVALPIDDPESPVTSPQFSGNCSVGGAWYAGGSFPATYQDTYFHAEFGGQWIRNFVFDGQDQLVEVRNFLDEGNGAIVDLAVDPAGQGLFYIAYDAAGCCMVRQISWVPNVPPTAQAAADPGYGPEPLAVQFSSVAGDPDGDPQQIRYEWSFADGQPISRRPHPLRTFPSADITLEGTFVGKILTLDPPNPVGGGNWDPEVMRDGDHPPVGSEDSTRQYDTFHWNDQGNEDWLGWEFAEPRELTALIFQEGRHFFDGGWFDTLAVQVRVADVWSPVSGLNTDPPYAGNNGVTFETYEMRFTPVTADAIRIYGNPGGGANFISVGELRVLATPQQPLGGPTPIAVQLSVTDALGGTAAAGVLVSVNNTPPMVQITSPADGSTYPITHKTLLPMFAVISDAEHSNSELDCAWQAILHHDEHIHPEPVDYNCISETWLSPVGCGVETYFYETTLTVTDAAGLSTTETSFVYPDCGTPCDEDGDCEDGNPCTANACVDSLCGSVEVADGTPCAGGAGSCLSGACAAGSCQGLADCADLDQDGVRDDNCLWWSCNGGTCNVIEILFADLGGQFGACPPDGVADINDLFQALNCFANIDTLGNQGFPCEETPPGAMNVDAVGLFGDCQPDGVCDLNDAFGALNAFSDTTPCACPAGAAPTPAAPAPEEVGGAGLTLRPRQRGAVRPGHTVLVDVYLDGPVADLRGYQLQARAAGGERGGLDLVDLAIEDRADHVFEAVPYWSAYNVRTRQLLAGLSTPGVEAAAGGYLATLAWRAGESARGRFVVDLLHGEGGGDGSAAGGGSTKAGRDGPGRTMLLPTPARGRIRIVETTPAVIVVEPAPPQKSLRFGQR